jgi:diketogulonate reductase-like aldo/keto reductase
MAPQFNFTLNNSVKIPGLGFGIFASKGFKGESYKATKKALKVGYRHLDCA